MRTPEQDTKRARRETRREGALGVGLVYSLAMGKDFEEHLLMSNRQFFTFSARFCLLLGLLFCIYRVGRRGIGDWYFRKGAPASIQTALKWDRDNPGYYDALGTLTHFYGTSGNLDESVQFYESATRLSPYDAHFWSDLGAAYDWAGRTNDALSAFKRALLLFPNSPEINWRFANFAFRAHKTPEALRSLQVVLAGNGPAQRDVFRLAVSATRDNRAYGKPERVPACRKRDAGQSRDSGDASSPGIRIL